MEARNKLPRNWPDFLSDSANKQELFTFLAKKIEFISHRSKLCQKYFIFAICLLCSTKLSHGAAHENFKLVKPILRESRGEE